MNDFEQFEQLVKEGHNCISIVSNEERYALDIVRGAAKSLNRDVWIWSISEGVRDGLSLLEDGIAIAETDKPDAGISNLAGAKAGSICVTLDLAVHLKDGKTLRLLRDMIGRFSGNGSTLVMIDYSDALPDVMKSYIRPFEISFPDENELKEIIRATLLHLHRKKPVEVGISRKGLDVIVRNLRGLTRRQAQRIIVDTVADDSRFDDNDINVVIASKRRMVQRDGLLEYIQTPLDLSEIGGMNRLKEWLNNRKNAFGAEAEKFGLTAPRGVLMLGVQGAGANPNGICGRHCSRRK